MAKWSEKMMVETPEGWNMGVAGKAVDTWNTCPHCNCKEGYLHDKFCPTQLRLQEGNPAAQPWGSVSNQWAGHTGCEYCGAKEGYRHQPSCVVLLGQYLGMAPIKTEGECFRPDTCPDCGEGTCEHAAPDNDIYNITVREGYYELFSVLRKALDQAQSGKGSERHASGEPFTEQPVLTITRAVGRGFPLGQAMKKIQECQRMDTDAAKRELLGAINYLAAAILSFDE